MIFSSPEQLLLFVSVSSFHLPSLSGDTYQEVGIQRVSPTSGKKHYTPDVASSIKPVVGQVFDSFDDAYVFYRTYAIAGGFTVRKNTQYSNNGVVKIRYYVCSKEGFKSVRSGYDTLDYSESQKQSRNKPSKRSGCCACIRVEWIDGMRKCRIYKFVEEHNHPFVNERDLHMLPAVRSLSYTQESAIHQLSSINVGPVQAFNILRTIYGGFENIGITKSDCKNFKKELNSYIGEFDAEMVVSRMMRKKDYLPNFSCEYVTDPDGRLRGLFWADEDCRRNYLTFCDVISFDATYKSNKYQMVLVPFTGIDNHNRNVILGCALLGNETAESYTWLLRAFMKTFRKEPLVIVTDQDPTMKKAISEVFVGARHRLCMWHIMEKLTSKLCHELCSNTDFKKRLCDIVWTDSISPEVFESEWNQIIDDFDLREHSWLGDLYDIRHDWIPAYYRNENLSGLMRTTSRSESENHFFSCLKVRSPFLEVLFRQDDCTIQCSCRRFEQFGLLCRHSFYVLRLCDVREFPKKYILRRWTREAVPSYQIRTHLERDEVEDESKREVEAVVHEIQLSTDYVINRFSTDLEKLRSFRDELKVAMKKADESQIKAPGPSRTDRIAALTGITQPEFATICVPIQSKTKGSGTRKRFKSDREKAISQSGKKPRRCKLCGQSGHDSHNHDKINHGVQPGAGPA